jgi:hypothetical protein
VHRCETRLRTNTYATNLVDIPSEEGAETNRSGTLVIAFWLILKFRNDTTSPSPAGIAEMMFSANSKVSVTRRKTRESRLIKKRVEESL